MKQKIARGILYFIFGFLALGAVVTVIALLVIVAQSGEPALQLSFSVAGVLAALFLWAQKHA